MIRTHRNSQTWDTDPFRVTEKDAKLYGRGTTDMKSFIAVVLAYVPIFLKRDLETPIHLAFSYDEGIGCIGVRRLIDKLYEITHTTVHTGIITGGVHLNIVPKTCLAEFEFRYLATDDPDALEDDFRTYARATLEPQMHAVDSDTGIDIDRYNDQPGLELNADEDIVTFAKALAGRNDHAKVAFGIEAGFFHSRVGIPTVVCGPGNIKQAHKPNEFISLEQIAWAEDFM